MPSEIKVPNAGESITSAVIAAWHKADGSAVQPGDVLVTIDTDKVSTELTAEAAGTLKIIAQPGEEVPIGAVIGTITEGAAPSASPAPAPAPPAPGAAMRAPFIETAAVPAVQVTPAKQAELPADKPAGTSGTDPASAPKVELTVLPKPAESAMPDAPGGSGRETRKRMTPLRRKIATHLVNAQHTAAILTTFNEADMSAVMELRKRRKESFQERTGARLGFMSFFTKAAIGALKAFPKVNAELQGSELLLKKYYDIGVAVSTDEGLVVPVNRDADHKNFAEIEQGIADLATKAREGKLTLEDLRGGTFTITNGGIFGSLVSTPILTLPQVAILGMHKIQERPVVIDGEVAVRPMMYLALSYDHRVIDGAEAVSFLVRIKELVEDPESLLLEG